MRELDQREAFEKVIGALRPEEDASERVEELEASLNRVGLLGPQLQLKFNVLNWSTERATGAWQRARVAGLPRALDPEDEATFDAARPPEDPDPERLPFWRRARKLLAKLLKVIDDFFGSLISAIPNVGEMITEVKQALESVLDR